MNKERLLAILSTILVLIFCCVFLSENLQPDEEEPPVTTIEEPRLLKVNTFSTPSTPRGEFARELQAETTTAPIIEQKLVETEETTTEPIEATTSNDEEVEIQLSTKPSYDDEQVRMLELVNEQRRAVGIEELSFSDEAMKIAKLRAEELAQQFSHIRPNGSKWHTIYKENGITYTAVAENINTIWQGYTSDVTAHFFNDWLNSPSHYVNIVAKNIKYFGCAIICIGGTYYGVQEFITY